MSLFNRLNYYQKKLLLNSYFVRFFLKRFTFLQLLGVFFLLAVLISYPGQNYFQTLYFDSNPPVYGATALLPPLTLPKFIGQQIPELKAASAIVLDLNSSTILYQKDSTLRLHPASTTKVMTALIALETYELDQPLTVKSADKAIGNSIDLTSGDQLTVRDLLLALLVSSANDAAVALAENYPDTGYQGFIEKMNQKAKELNLVDTSFTNVSGIESSGHKTTVRDLALLTKEALKNTLIREIVSTRQTTITTINTGKSYDLVSTNLLLGSIPGVLGFKTGWTENAGECLITYVERDNHPIITVVLNSPDRFGESIILIDWVYQSHNWITLD